MAHFFRIILYIILGIGTLGGTGLGYAYIPYIGEETNDKWSAEQTFDMERDVAESFAMENGKHEDGFVIMNLADIQLNSIQVSTQKKTFEMLEILIDEVNPDLITLTGDQVGVGYTRSALKKICKFLDETGIPWAPVLGNHDGDGNVTNNGNADIFKDYENCIFEKNDPEMGVGNYLINITNGGQPVHTIVMMDSHSLRTYEDGETDYDYIWENQIDWYEWAIKGLKRENSAIQSSCLFHIPLVQYIDAWEGYQNGIYQGGNKCEDSIACAKFRTGNYDSGLYAKIQELGSTKLVLTGHNHENNYYVDYNGVTLAFALKSGFGSYYSEDMLGATTITIAPNGTSSLAYYGYNIESESVYLYQ